MHTNSNDKTIQSKSCWECRYIDLTGNTFLGRCLWFREHGLEVKGIPARKVDEGYQHFQQK